MKRSMCSLVIEAPVRNIYQRGSSLWTNDVSRQAVMRKCAETSLQMQRTYPGSQNSGNRNISQLSMFTDVARFLEGVKQKQGPDWGRVMSRRMRNAGNWHVVKAALWPQQ